MFRITRDPSSGSLMQCVCLLHSLESASLYCAVHTRTMGKYAAMTPTMSMPTDTIEPLL